MVRRKTPSQVPPPPLSLCAYLTAQTSKSRHFMSIRGIHPPSRKNLIPSRKIINPIHPHRLPFPRLIPQQRRHTLHSHPPFLRPHHRLPPPRRMGRKITQTNLLTLALTPLVQEFHPVGRKTDVVFSSIECPPHSGTCAVCTAFVADVCC